MENIPRILPKELAVDMGRRSTLCFFFFFAQIMTYDGEMSDNTVNFIKRSIVQFRALLGDVLLMKSSFKVQSGRATKLHLLPEFIHLLCDSVHL